MGRLGIFGMGFVTTVMFGGVNGERGEAVWASHLLDCGFLTKEAMLYV